MEFLIKCLDEYEGYYKFYNIKDYKDELSNLYESMENWLNSHKDIKKHDNWEDIEKRLYEAKAKMEYANTCKIKNFVRVYHSVKGVYKCAHCNFETKSKCSIMSHYQSYDHFYTIGDNEGMEKCKCSSCDKIFPTIKKRIRHESMCKESNYCNKCCKTFSTHNYFKKHVCKTLAKIDPYCNICDKRFASVQCFKNHQNTDLHKKKVNQYMALSQK